MTRINQIDNQPAAIKFSFYIFIGLLAYMPLHIFLSTWAGSSLGLLNVTKSLKDIVMIAGFLPLLFVAYQKSQIKPLLKNRLIQIILIYGLLTLILALFKPTDQDAEILGVVYNTRFLIFFLYGALLARFVDYVQLRKYALSAVLASALITLVFGILQYTMLPNDALRHVGYTKSNGVLPAFFIDDKPDLERVMSTVRDPNSFGSYLIIIISLAFAILLSKKSQRQLALGYLALGFLCLWFTFSRSAWIGALISIGIISSTYFARAKLPRSLIRKMTLIGAVTFFVLLAATYGARNTYFVQNVVFHADQSTVLEDPNELRIRFWKESLEGVKSDPLGNGPGTAGLASIKNQVQGTQLNENYYLQLASEVGVLGLMLFMAILAMLGLELFKVAEKDWLALALLGSLAGLAVANFLVHIWSNEAVAYTWWGLASLVVLFTAPVELSKKSGKKS